MSKATDLMRQQHAELSAQRAAILAKSVPLRLQRDQIKNDALEQARQLDAQIKDAEKDLPQMDMDLGRLSRALGGLSLSQVKTAN